MRKIIMFNLISLDGYFAGINGEIDWFNVNFDDDEFNEFNINQTKMFDTIIFGRVTYEMMAEYWVSPQALKDESEIAEIMNNTLKIVFSKTLEKVEENEKWKNIKLLKKIEPDEINKLKQSDGKAIAIFGSGSIVEEFTNLGLIDEYRLLVNPLFLGYGKLLFKNVQKLNLKLIDVRKFKSGNVLLIYQPS
jgi:dihydrofolate reductase